MSVDRRREPANASTHRKLEAAAPLQTNQSYMPSINTPAKTSNGSNHRAEEFVKEAPANAGAERSLSPEEETHRFLDVVVEELSALRTRAEIDAIEKAADLILQCEANGGRVHVTGVGKSEYVARYIASLLSSTGTPSYFLHATECVHGSAGQLCKSDVAIAISNSGTTPELISTVDALKELNIRIIGVSGARESSLASSSDVFLYAGVDNEGGSLNLAPRASILAESYVLCALSVALEARKGLTREQYARWHPGGMLGKIARGD